MFSLTAKRRIPTLTIVNRAGKRRAYFTADGIDAAARDMLNTISPFRARHPVEIDPPHLALVVLDMQRYFSDEDSHAFIPSFAAILPRVVRLAESVIGRRRPVLVTRHIDSEETTSPMRSWWRDALREDEPRSRLVDDIDRLGAREVKKRTYDAFHATDLDRRLRNANVEQIVVCGVHTHLCCETTARSAFVRGFGVFLAIDGTATYSEAHHRATLLNLAHGFAVPVLCSEVVSALGAS